MELEGQDVVFLRAMACSALACGVVLNRAVPGLAQ